MAAKTSNVALPFLLLGFLLMRMCLAQTAPSLSVSQDAAGNVSASVSGSISPCGITADGGVPTFSIEGAVITVTQPVVAITCVNPPPPDRFYQETVVFGKLPAATYTVDWSFPALTTTYTVVASEVNFSFTLTTSANPAQVGQAVDLVAVVVGGGAGRTDTMTFSDGFGTIYGGTDLCTNVAVSVIASQEIAHCVATFAEVGHHYVSATLTVGPPGVVITGSNEIEQTITAPVSFDADQFSLTGTWSDAYAASQGLLIQVSPDYQSAGNGLLFAGWFTYDTAGHQQWLTLQGTLAAAHVSSYALGIYQTTGGGFDAAGAVDTVAVGTASLTFYDCTHAALAYRFNDGRTGTIPYTRLSNATSCSTAVPVLLPVDPAPNDNDILHSGAWFNPATSGQGVVFDIIPSQTTLFAAWFTYAPPSEGLSGLGAQRWFTIQSNDYTPGNLNFNGVPVYASSGGFFDSPLPTNLLQVGTADITFTSCSTMTIQYTFTQGEFAGLMGSIDEQTLVPVSGCQ